MTALPDQIASRLKTDRLGRRLIFVDRTTSTMDEARRLALADAPFGTTIVAGEQTAGRGRADRPFVSPPGGLYLTVVLTPPGEPADGWRCGFAAALAARAAVLAAGGPELVFDWPNDLILGERKVGGVLLDLLALPEGAAEPFALLLGVGLNLGPDPCDIDSATAGPAGPIRGLPPGDARAAVAAGLLNALEGLLRRCGDEAGWRVVLESVRSISRAAQGHRVTVRDPDGRLIAGSGVGIREDGALLVKQDDGNVAVVRCGERVYTER